LGVSFGVPPSAFDTGEALVNPISGTSSLSAESGTDAAMTLFPPRNDWPGLADASGQLGVPLDSESLERFARYRDFLLERSTRFNLTAIRDPAEIERRLFLDAIAMVPELDRLIEANHGRTDSRVRLIDVGTGAGFPGLALKIVRPGLDVTLVDATAKKVAFVNEAIEAMALDAVRAVQGRAEELGKDRTYRAQFEVATARAVASLPVLLEYVIPLLKVGGTALLPKGLEIADELKLGRRAAAMLGAEIVSASKLQLGTTRLVIARKIAPTIAAHPRRPGVPRREPLGERS
jgi:16S rRNA (guanine527-N7)-methyltransferase